MCPPCGHCHLASYVVPPRRRHRDLFPLPRHSHHRRDHNGRPRRLHVPEFLCWVRAHVRLCLQYHTHTQHAAIDDPDHYMFMNLSEMPVGTTSTTVPTDGDIMAAEAA